MPSARLTCLLLALSLSIALTPLAPASAEPVDLTPTSSPSTQHPSPTTLDWLLTASDRMQAGDDEGTATALEQAHALEPDDADLTLALADAYDRAHWYGAAAAAYAEAGALAPSRADLALAQARFHLARAFRIGTAVAAAERAVRLLPGDPEAVRLLDRARSAAALSAAS